MPIADMRFFDTPAVPNVMTQRLRALGSADSPWKIWQCQVVDLLRNEPFQGLQVSTLDDVDWLAWQPYFSQGKSPRQAIEQALERAL